jgi:predicted nuclease of predicted toxin-antitoxin system
LKGFVFDENVPRQLRFQPSLPFTHVAELGRGMTDGEIWELARLQELVIVTKDTDFSNRIMLNTPPPWVVHLRFGNMRRSEFHAFLARIGTRIEALLPRNKLVNVYLDRIEAIK